MILARLLEGGRPPALPHAAALCWIAGFVDAIGYFHFGHVFPANMTGNTVLLGAFAVRGEVVAWTYLATLAAFAAGVVTAVLLRRLGTLAAPFLLDAALLVTVGWLAPDRLPTLLALAFAMGVQGGTLATFSGIRLPTVVVTSTLVNLIEGLMLRTSAATRASPAASGRQLGHLAVAWILYGLGGAAAALFTPSLALMLAPAFVYVLIAVHLR